MPDKRIVVRTRDGECPVHVMTPAERIATALCQLLDVAPDAALPREAFAEMMCAARATLVG